MRNANHVHTIGKLLDRFLDSSDADDWSDVPDEFYAFVSTFALTENGGSLGDLDLAVKENVEAELAA
ncbi:hypothetical protein [Halolamina sp.]|jgi:hypothetical protein|uniref:hypothetical protein n=1 Tax=Halolamina sp. TaxID=1940283 RepID=UPI000223B773|nr:hypothetical protein Halar_1738 [halophilic archaeon DL31]